MAPRSAFITSSAACLISPSWTNMNSVAMLEGQAEPLAGEQAELLSWFRGQVATLQDERRQRYTHSLAERSAAYVQARCCSHAVPKQQAEVLCEAIYMVRAGRRQQCGTRCSGGAQERQTSQGGPQQAACGGAAVRRYLLPDLPAAQQATGATSFVLFLAAQSPFHCRELNLFPRCYRRSTRSTSRPSGRRRPGSTRCATRPSLKRRRLAAARSSCRTAAPTPWTTPRIPAYALRVRNTGLVGHEKGALSPHPCCCCRHSAGLTAACTVTLCCAPRLPSRALA
jgi:hypothetical protein